MYFAFLCVFCSKTFYRATGVFQVLSMNLLYLALSKRLGRNGNVICLVLGGFGILPCMVLVGLTQKIWQVACWAESAGAGHRNRQRSTGRRAAASNSSGGGGRAPGLPKVRPAAADWRHGGGA